MARIFALLVLAATVTGATAGECSAVLKSLGVKAVHVLTIAID